MLALQKTKLTALGTKSTWGGQKRPGGSVHAYSTIQRRPKPSSGPQGTYLPSERPDLTEKQKRKLDKQFDDTFFRKPKVLIIGTDISALTAALVLLNFNVVPDILDTGHYMHPLAPTAKRGCIVPMNAMRIFDNLNISRNIEAIGTPIKMIGRADSTGSALASLNYDSLRIYQDRPTLGVKFLDLQRVLHEEVAKRAIIQPQCIIQSINSPPLPETSLAVVKWKKGAMSVPEDTSGVYDAVIIGDGTFSAARDLHRPEKFNIDGPAALWETIIPRPKEVMKGYSSEQWGHTQRVGFFPVDASSKDQLYVYAHTRITSTEQGPIQKAIPSTQFLSHFSEFGGPWKQIAEAVGAQPYINQSVVVTGEFDIKDGPTSGRVVTLGDAALTFPSPCMGHDIGAGIESANYLANVLAFNSSPILMGIDAFRQRYSVIKQQHHASLTDLQVSTLVQSRFPKWLQKMVLKFSFSDRGLLSQELKWLGLDLDHQAEVNETPFGKLAEMREEWYNLKEEERSEAIRLLASEVAEAQKILDEQLAKRAPGTYNKPQ